MMAMDGSGGKVDMNASIGTESHTESVDLVLGNWIQFSLLPLLYNCYSFPLWKEEIIDADCSMRRQYELTIRQEPKQARLCGIGGKADRRPIDPPVIVQLRVIDPAALSSYSHPASSSSAGPPSSSPSRDRENGPQDSANADSDDPPYTKLTSYAQSFRQNLYYVMFASLAKPDEDTELHWLKDGRARCTTGSVVSSLYALKDPTAPGAASSNSGDESGSPAAAQDRPTAAFPASDAGFFVFPDLSVRKEDSYRLKLSLFEVVGNDVRHCKSTPFYVYTAIKVPRMEGVETSGAGLSRVTTPSLFSSRSVSPRLADVARLVGLFLLFPLRPPPFLVLNLLPLVVLPFPSIPPSESALATPYPLTLLSHLANPPLHRILPLTCSLADQGIKIRIRNKSACARQGMRGWGWAGRFLFLRR
ncbi:velvet factor-domain-containing protein [Mycena galopus ATCC 62051]|nr:velvet factor-domain-containing protein [Mycena galopus ATCC 62051]